MGAYSTQSIIDDKMRDWLVHHIACPVVEGMKAEGAEFKGVLYCGLMMTARGPMVLEFNCRFGDPETQPILMRLESDLVDALEASIAGRVSEGDFKWSRDASVCVAVSYTHLDVYKRQLWCCTRSSRETSRCSLRPSRRLRPIKSLSLIHI